MGIGIERFSREQAIFIVLLTMLTGVFISRALLSISMLFFILLTCFHATIRQQIKACFQQKFLIGLSLLFFIPFISGLWSDNTQEWLHVVRIKLPLLLLPVAFAGSWQLSGAQWRRIFYFLLLLLAAGCCWSLLQYAGDVSTINKSYLKAKSIPTPFENDHVRFSWVIAVALAGISLLIPKIKRAAPRLLLVATAVFFVIYLHILSARTGLACLYFFIFAYFLHLAFQSRRKKILYVLMAALIAMPVIAWFTLPTFQNRLRYIAYDFSFIEKGAYLPGGNDGNRILSIKAGWHILSQNFFGIGAGDIRQGSNDWYVANVPGMLDSDKLLPSSEWLIYGAAAGWIGILIFTAVMLFPLSLNLKSHRFAWMAINSMAALSFLFDIGLEVQFGVFVYTFIVLCFYKWVLSENKLPVVT